MSNLQRRLDRLEQQLGSGQPVQHNCTCNLPTVVWDDALDDAPDGESICPKCGGLRFVVSWASISNDGDGSS